MDVRNHTSKIFAVADRFGKLVGFIQSANRFLAKEKLKSLKEEYEGINGYSVYNPGQNKDRKEYIPKYDRMRIKKW